MKALKNFLRPFIPKKVFLFFQPAYHYLLAFFSALFYGFPSRNIHIVAITGTKGKTSTAEMVNAILEEAGWKTALGGSLRFKIGNKSELNTFGMSMPGGGFLQKFIKQAVKEKCDWIVLEMTSEGAKQFRHKFIHLDALIFTNLAPEHIESHGSFEQYIQDKKQIAILLGTSPKVRRVAILNGSDKYVHEFNHHSTTETILYSMEDAKPYTSNSGGITMQFDGVTIHSPLIGEFNILNMVAAAHFAKSFGIEMPVIARAFSKLNLIRGRMEHITLKTNHPLKNKQNFDAVIDYAHTIESLEALYSSFPNQRKICVLGNTGGGRDTWKRPGMAEIADKYCDEIILTTEDPYDEDPLHIIEDMRASIKNHTPKIIIDRSKAIREAVLLAKENDVVLATGMGSQQYMCVAKGKKIPWDDASVMREAIEKKLSATS
jgi:UDP-N-acetylmuramoyl-L-alanyl-D-glutamate--2,6-diaminopimelate ligase